MIYDIVLKFFEAWKYGKIRAKKIPSKNVLSITKKNKKWFSNLKQQDKIATKIYNIIALNKNREIFNLTSFTFALLDTKI